MPDLLERVFTDEQSGNAPQPDMLDRVFSEPDSVATATLDLPDDEAEQDRILKDVLDISAEFEIPIHDTEANYRKLTEKPMRTAATGGMQILAAPTPTGWEKFKGFFVGERPPLPPDADRIEKITRALDIGITGPLRAFLKLGKGMTLGAPDLMWAALKRITPDDMWDDEVKNMTLDEAMDWAGGYNPSGFQKSVGEMAEFVGRLRTVAPIAGKLGIIRRTPKDISVLDKAAEAAKLFGTAAVGEQAAKLAATKIDPTEAEYGFEGPKAVLRDMAIGAIFSIAHSGVKAVWTKLTPTEHIRALKTLGLKKGATPEQITRASQNMARKYHPDKAKGFEEEFKKVIEARDLLRKGESQDIVFRGQKVTLQPKVLPGEIVSKPLKPKEPTQRPRERQITQPGQEGATVAPRVEPAEPKEVWQMTNKEVRDTFGAKKGTKEYWTDYHKFQIQESLKEGKPVPRHVLEEYKSEKWAQEALRESERPGLPEKAEPKGKKDVTLAMGVEPGVGKFIKEDIRPAIERAKEFGGKVKDVGLGVGKMFMSIIEPAKAAEKKAGKSAYAAVIKGIHTPEAKKLQFEQTELEAMDTNIAEFRKWLSEFPKEDQGNFMVAFAGQPGTPAAAATQQAAENALPEALKEQKLVEAVREIAERNYKYLNEVAKGRVGYVKDYFYGVWKDQAEVDKFIAFWKTTKRFMKHKNIPSMADGINYGLEPKHENYVDNLTAEFMGIARLESMIWLRDELMRAGKGAYIDNMMDAPQGWSMVHDPVFDGYRVMPELAKLIDNLISTNKVTQSKVLSGLRAVNNVLRTAKFIGSAFHLGVEAKVSLADSGFLGFLRPWKKTTTRAIALGFKKNDPIFKTPEYLDYVGIGGEHKYSVEAQALDAFKSFVEKIESGNYIGATLRAGRMPLHIPLEFVEWMFEKYIPKLKYAKYLDKVAELETKTGRALEDWEKINIIKEGQNFYGEMNERLFGRSATATSVLRFFFMAPGFAEGNYRTILKSLTQWGWGEKWSASRSRANIPNSLLITAIAATVGTLIFTRKPPKAPETLEDVRDLLKIDTGKLDKDGKRIMVDLLTYDKDYWNIMFNTLRGRPDKAVFESIRRLGGMKAPLFEMALDFGKMATGQAIYDWKGDRVTEITDSSLEKLMKIAIHEVKKTEPISVSVFKTARRKHVGRIVSFVEAVTGVRPTISEKDKREREIMQRCWSLKGQQEELYVSLASLRDPRGAIKWYNEKVRDVLEGPLVPEEMRTEWEKNLIIDLDKFLENKAQQASVNAITEDSQRSVERAVRVLKNFGITADEAVKLRRARKVRMAKKPKKPISPLESQPIIGDMIKEKRLRERMAAK